mmetsp:Transcript_152853/g.488360  ORF Transcript_152853/g.488360 Transcript_152853/m.488360 type:complete len:718 (+) Transcript_152853:25-2178(+)
MQANSDEMAMSCRPSGSMLAPCALAAVVASPAFVTPLWQSAPSRASPGSKEGLSGIDAVGESAPQGGAPQGGAAMAAGAAVGMLMGARAVAGQRRGGHQKPRIGLTARRAAAVRELRPRDRTDGHGWIKEDPQFTDTDNASVASTHTVTFKKRPSGIKRYTHGMDGKGAMVMEMAEKARYPGDPLGQAAVAGVKKGFVVKSVAGKDVRGWDFEDIMDLLEDYVPNPDVQSTAAFKSGKVTREKKNKQVDFPAEIEYMELKEGAVTAGAPAASAMPKGAWMPRLSPWSDEDLKKERERAMAFPDPANYTGPRYTNASSLDEAWIKKLIAFQKDGGNLPKKDAYLLVLDTIARLRSETTLMDVVVKPGQTLTVFGDLHGQYFDVMNMLDMTGLPSETKPFLFNGDFVDRGSWSIEVITLLFAMKLKDPDRVYFNRGNHEMLEANIIYGFAGETGSKYDLELFNLFSEAFRNLPLLHLINKEILVVHAGLPGPRPRVWLPGQTHDPEDAVPVNVQPCMLDEIRTVDRYTELSPNSYKAAVDDSPRQEEKYETDTRMIIDFLWADPRGGAGYGPSYRKSRGVFMFGPDVTQQFAQANKLKMVIRSHEVKSQGWLQDHPSLMSVFSAPNYLDTGGNSGAFLQLTPGADGTLDIKPTTFTAVPHPDLPAMHHQQYITNKHPHLTRTMTKKQKDMGDEFGDSDFAGYAGPDDWEEVEAGQKVKA